MDKTEISQRLFDAVLGAMDKWSAARIDPRYATEWLEQQTVTGLLEVDDHDLLAHKSRYALPPSHAEVLTNPDSLAYLDPFIRLTSAAGMQLPALIEA